MLPGIGDKVFEVPPLSHFDSGKTFLYRPVFNFALWTDETVDVWLSVTENRIED